MYVTITGGGFVNKGAEAMTYASIKYLESAFPEDQIVVFCRKPEKELKNKKIQIIEDNFFVRTYLCCPWLRSLIRDRVDIDQCERMKEIFQSTRLNLDVSGYALGSNWGNVNSTVFLMKIYTGKRFHFPVYILPQSIGPFRYRGIKGFAVYQMIKHLLKYPRIIFAREKQGYDLLKSIGLKNVRLVPDLVLTSQEDEEPVELQIQQPAAAIIPNERNLDYVDTHQMISIYGKICASLQEKGYHVYLLTHSGKDSALCEEIAQKIPCVNYIDTEWNSMQINSVLKYFQIGVVSRYHALVHSYKVALPCVVIGWTDKYHELMKHFGQENYYLNIRADQTGVGLRQILLSLVENREAEKGKLEDGLNKLRGVSVFEEVTNDFLARKNEGEP